MENVQDVLRQLSEQTTKSVDELEDDLDDKFEEVKEKKPGLDDEQAKKVALNQFKASWRKRLASGGETFKVMVIGVGRRVNYNRSKYDDAIELYEEDPEKAIEKGIVKEDENGDPVPLHYIPDSKRDSAAEWELDREGEPLDEYNWGRTIHGAVYDDEADTWRYAEINARDEASEKEPPTFKVCNVELYKRQGSSADKWQFYESGNFEFEVSEEPDDKKVRSIMEDALSHKKFDLSEMEEYDNQSGDYEIGVLEAMVTNISSRRTDQGSLRVELQDDSLELFGDDGDFQDPITGWFPERVEINFPERAEVIVVGSTNVYEDDDGNMRKNLNVVGCYTPPHFRNEMPEADDVDEDSDADW